MITRLFLADLDAILRIERKSFSEPWTRQMYAAEFENPHSDTWGWQAKETGKLLGYLTGWLLFEEYHVANLAVHPDSRGQGIGRCLLRYALNWALERGAEVSLLEVRASNEAALELYRSEGYSLISTRPLYYRFPTEDALILRKKLLTHSGGVR